MELPRTVLSGTSQPMTPLPANMTLARALIAARAKFGGRYEILEDPERNPLTYDRLILASLILGRKLIAGTKRGERVGILLPNVTGMAVSLFGLSFRGRVPVLLNFTAGAKNLVSACATAEIGTIVTARRFIDNAKLDDVVAALGQRCRILYLEDVRKTIGAFDKIRGVIQSRFPRVVARAAKAKSEDAGVVLFTSGTEGQPKGVVLSHGNLLGNVFQIAAHAGTHLTPADTVFNPLPMFHSFGLTAGSLLGLFTGMKVVLYPSPLHYKQVPKLIGETGANVLFGTDTFLQGYAKAAAPGDLDKVRIVVVGAERVKDETRNLWSAFGSTIIEGYGATECSPVICCNLPPDNRSGTVGPFLPGLRWELLPVEGIEEGGRLRVQGPNVMAGYMLAEAPGKLVPPQEGWHDTGDIVSVSEDGFCTILGRAKRFAKIGGEMVSLAAIEGLASQLWPGATHVGVILPDPKKGEQIVLVTDRPDADRAGFLAYAREQGVPELYVPRAVLVSANIPVLGSGKVDYAATTQLAQTMRTLM